MAFSWKPHSVVFSIVSFSFFYLIKKIWFFLFSYLWRVPCECTESISWYLHFFLFNETVTYFVFLLLQHFYCFLPHPSGLPTCPSWAMSGSQSCLRWPVAACLFSAPAFPSKVGTSEAIPRFLVTARADACLFQGFSLHPRINFFQLYNS